jgi:hypothetical protein
MTPASQPDAIADTRDLDRRWSRAETLYLILLVAAGFLLRVWGLSKMHFWDENVYLQDAEVICCGKTNYSELDSRPPLLSLIFAGCFLLWNSTYAALTVTALLNAAGAAWTYLSGRMIAGRVPAVIASLLFAFAPFFVGVFPAGPSSFVINQGGHSLLADAPALSLIALSFWLLLRALQKQTFLRFAAAGLALALCVLMRFGSLSSVAVLSLLTLCADRRARAVLATATGFALGMGPYLCWSRLRYGGFLTTLRNGWNGFQGPAESPLFYIKLYGDIFTWISLAGLVLWIGRSTWRVFAQRDADFTLRGPLSRVRGARWLEGFLWLWGAVVLVFFSALRHSEPRYIMPLAAPLFLLAGIGLSVLLKGRRRGARIAGAAVLGCALLYTFLPLRHRFDSGFIDRTASEEMEVSDYLNRNVPPGTVLYANSNYPDFAYYTNLPIDVLDEGGPELYRDLNTLDADGVLVAYKQGDDGSAVEPRLDWVDANPRFRRLREFPSLVLYRYCAPVSLPVSPNHPLLRSPCTAASLPDRTPLPASPQSHGTSPAAKSGAP